MALAAVNRRAARARPQHGRIRFISGHLLPAAERAAGYERSGTLNNPDDFCNVIQRECVMLNRATLVRVMEAADKVEPDVEATGINHANRLIHFRSLSQGRRNVGIAHKGCRNGFCEGIRVRLWLTRLKSRLLCRSFFRL